MADEETPKPEAEKPRSVQAGPHEKITDALRTQQLTSKKIVYARTLRKNSISWAIASTFPGKQVESGKLFALEQSYQIEAGKVAERYMNTKMGKEDIAQLKGALNQIMLTLHEAKLLPQPIACEAEVKPKPGDPLGGKALFITWKPFILELNKKK